MSIAKLDVAEGRIFPLDPPLQGSRHRRRISGIRIGMTGAGVSRMGSAREEADESRKEELWDDGTQNLERVCERKSADAFVGGRKRMKDKMSRVSIFSHGRRSVFLFIPLNLNSPMSVCLSFSYSSF